MASTDDTSRPNGRNIYEASLSGEQTRPFIPRLRSDHPKYSPIPHSLVEFRNQEGRDVRKQRLHDLWKQLPKPTQHGLNADPSAKTIAVKDDEALTLQKAQRLKSMYENELLGRCGGHIVGPLPSHIRWKDFKKYAEAKEVGMLSNFLSLLSLTQSLRTMVDFS
jgi:solute carrier family 25 (mitochondrial phosphate transporter), member 23/24/25/41